MFLSRSNKLHSVNTQRYIRQPLKQQRGVAIITALLIVTLAATISITISTQLQLDVRRTSNMVALDQAHVYSLLAEEYLQIILQDDTNRDELIEYLINEGIVKQPIPLDDVLIVGEVTDLSACININALVDANGNINAITEARLTQLFNNRNITVNLTQAIADWIDPDLTGRIPDGAEDGYYMNLEKPYRTAMAPLQSITELRLIKGFEDNDIYANITELVNGTYQTATGHFPGPALCAFNTNNNNIPININTASVEVLESIQPNITQAQIDNILSSREDNAYTSVPALFTTPANLVTESSYYLLKTRAIIGNANKVMYSIIYWDGSGNTEVISRTQRTL